MQDEEVSMRIAQRSAILILIVTFASTLWAANLTAQYGEDSTSQDKQFVMKSIEGSMAEVELGKLALKKSDNEEVKQFAKKMVTDHTKLITDMKPFADQMGITPPSTLSPKHQKLYDQLKGLSGTEFDKEYISAMVTDHHNDLHEFKAQESSTSNPDLKKTVSQGIEVIQAHTHMIDQIAEKNGISVPSTPTSNLR
jgi:putative membrane protein